MIRAGPKVGRCSTWNICRGGADRAAGAADAGARRIGGGCSSDGVTVEGRGAWHA